MKSQSDLAESRGTDLAVLLKRATRSPRIIAVLVSAAATCGPSPTSLPIVGVPASVFGVPAPEQPSSVAHRRHSANPTIVGLWLATFTSGGQVFGQGFDQWHQDGTEILIDNSLSQPANGTGSACLGVYKQIGPRTYSLKHPFWIFDSTGNLAGTGVYTQQVTVDSETTLMTVRSHSRPTICRGTRHFRQPAP